MHGIFEKNILRMLRTFQQKFLTNQATLQDPLLVENLHFTEYGWSVSMHPKKYKQGFVNLLSNYLMKMGVLIKQNFFLSLLRLYFLGYFFSASLNSFIFRIFALGKKKNNG
ncbi:MAG: hypothetical protein RIQ89_611 [Bacteroidota bacterium]|jgi:hypothetical protein